MEILNFGLLMMISITPNGALGKLSLDSIPLPWQAAKSGKGKKKKGAVAGGQDQEQQPSQA